MSQTPPELLRELEIEGYTAVMRAIYAGTYDWEKEEILTKLRSILSIDNNQHADVLVSVKEEMQAIRAGGGRVARAKPLTGKVPYVATGVGPRKPSAGVRALPGVASTPRAHPQNRTPARSKGSRPAGHRASGAADPYEYVGRRVWRYWPSETPPWVEGYVYEYDADTGMHSILYDPNQGERETLEDGYSFANADSAEYVLGEFVDVKTMPGSRRVAERPSEAPVPGPAAALAASAAATPDRQPSKKRRTAPGPLPTAAPFDPLWLDARLQVAGEDELQSLYSLLDRKEIELAAELGLLEQGSAEDEDRAARAALEAQFQALCERETGLMAELAALTAVEE
ncbi:hypothetical protein ACKKBG_A24280 [Auxenochlorella protothecoides x Auxenochlorella symbiontica]